MNCLEAKVDQVSACTSVGGGVGDRLREMMVVNNRGCIVLNNQSHWGYQILSCRSMRSGMVVCYTNSAVE